MSVWQKALLIALSVSCQQLIVGMNEKLIRIQNELKEVQEELRAMENHEEIKYKALEILKFTRNKKECQNNDQNMVNLGFWLEAKRNRHTPDTWDRIITDLILEATQTNQLIEQLKGDCSSCGAVAFTRTKDVLEVINTIARALQPGQKCTQLLVDEVRKVIEAQRLLLEYGPFYKDYLAYETKNS